MAMINARIGAMSNDALKELLSQCRVPLSVAVYGSENYFNMGAIVRLCHGFLVNTIYAVDCPKHYRRADMGTRKYENIVRLSQAEFLEQTRDHNLVCFENREGLPANDLRTFEYPERPIMVFGSEKDGVPGGILLFAHSIVAIPMFGVHNDHNVGVAAGMALYDYSVKKSDEYTKAKEVFNHLKEFPQ